MNILIIAPRFPYPPDKGDRLTIFNYLKSFYKRHNVVLITFIQKDELGYLNEVKQYCKQIISIPHKKPIALHNIIRWSLTGMKPMQVSYYCGQKQMQKAINECIQTHHFDLLYCHTIRMAEYIKDLKNIPKILALQISMQLNYRRLAKYSTNIAQRVFYQIEGYLVKDYEYDICNSFDKNLLISEKDLEEIQGNKTSKIRNVFFLPHGVDHIYFNNADLKKRQNATLIITGNMGYPPNQDAVKYFCDSIFPIIKKKKPDCKLFIVGKNPSPGIRRYNDDTNIFVTGGVKDIRPYLSKATVCVVPTRIAAGLQNKLIEGLSMGLPVVATSNANEGIRAIDGEHLIIADSPDRFAQEVIDFLCDTEKRKLFSKNARKFIEDQFTWEYFINKLETLMKSMV